MLIRPVVPLTLLVLFCCAGGRGTESPPRELDFWEVQKKGANFFNRVPSAERFRAASELGVEFIRLAPDKWSTAGRDFLMGSADHFTEINREDLNRLSAALDSADAQGLKVVLAMLSLPGARWRQNNENKDDDRLWRSPNFQAQARRFWRDLAAKLRHHPAVVAYDLLNEPHPEKSAGLDGTDHPGFGPWLSENRGTTADLDLFYRGLVGVIRTVDPHTPILVEGYGYASARGLTYLTPMEDAGILYSFHFYEPWNYTTKRVNRNRYAYPDRMPSTWEGSPEKWTIESLRRRMQPVVDWATRHSIPASRIVAAEFGCDREVEGARAYLSDQISILNGLGYHWAFYSFREDVWNGMDYELGTGSVRLGTEYWTSVREGRYVPKPWHLNPLFNVLRREFQK